jgi:hypothetical protein
MKGQKMRNRYAGECSGCAGWVPVNSGEYDWGVLLCEVIAEEIAEHTRREFHAWAASLGVASHETCAVLFSRWSQQHNTPARQAEREAAAVIAAQELAAAQATTRAELVSGGLEELGKRARVRSLAAVVAKIAPHVTTLEELTYGEAVAVREELHTRIARRERAAENKANGGAPCRKCGGSGAFWRLGASGTYVDDGCWGCDRTGKRVR